MTRNNYSKILLLFIISIFSINGLGNNSNINKKLTSSDLHLDTIELADTAYKRSLGLMYRDEFCDTCAMLFVYSYPSRSPFWMKNTKISLDIIFMDPQGKIINIHRNTEPLNTNKKYHPKASYLYALEAKSGFADKYTLNPEEYIDVADLFTKAAVKGVDNK